MIDFKLRETIEYWIIISFDQSKSSIFQLVIKLPKQRTTDMISSKSLPHLFSYIMRNTKGKECERVPLCVSSSHNKCLHIAQEKKIYKLFGLFF